jgi:hypothetical protein
MVKETVIIVHGTWAAPKPGVRSWYQPSEGGHPATAFADKLDGALQKRGSSARCWAHCTGARSYFHWSAENNWIERTTAATKLAEYLVALRDEGWLCHVIAHSHAGNIIVEAMQQLIRRGGGDKMLGRIVTLGTPFMDAMSPIIRRSNTLSSATPGIIVSLILAPRFIVLFPPIFFPYLAVAALVLIFLLYRLYSSAKNAEKAKMRIDLINSDKPFFLVVSTQDDEAWQVLYHLMNIDNPFIVRSTILSYLFASVVSHLRLKQSVARTLGAKEYHDFGILRRLFFLFSLFYMMYRLVFIGLHTWRTKT